MDTSRVLHGPQRAIVMTAVMAASFMQILDTTIANVALPHMQAALGANQESINWVLTSYIVASAIATPLTGWLDDHVGRKRLMIMSVAVFTGASVLCATANSLTAMVLFRVLQGIGGAFIGPVTQATLFDIYEPKDHPKAMSIYAAGLVLAPIVGPVLGGWLTDNYNWRWVFLINVPVGLFGIFMLIRGMPKFPQSRHDFDIRGFMMIAIALASLQLLLDRGQSKDWFDSTEIMVETGLAIAAFWMFAVHTATARNPLFDRAILRDRNFLFGMVLMGLSAMLLMSGLALLPPLLQQLLGYPVLKSGMLTGVRGVGATVVMQLMPRIAKKVDPRILIAAGLATLAFSFHIMAGFSLEMGWQPIVIAGLVQGVGFGLCFTPMQTLAFATIAPQMRTSAASMFNLMRSIGGSIGIAILTALLARNVQISHADLAAHVTSQNLPLGDPSVINRLGDAGQQVMAMINAEVSRQAMFIAYLDDFWVMTWAAVLAIPMVLLIRVRKQQGAPAGEPVMMHE